MNKPYIDISDQALGEIKNIMNNKNIPEGYGLRIGVNSSGCSGVRQFLGFDKQKEGDDVFDVEGLSLYIDKKHAMYLIGLLLDYQNDNDATGFVFKNPALQVEDQQK